MNDVSGPTPPRMGDGATSARSDARSQPGSLQGDLERIQEKLSPSNIRLTLAFAGLFQVVHEQLKQQILHKLESFYMVDFFSRKLLHDSGKFRRRYESEVIALDSESEGRPSAFKASSIWLKNAGVLGEEDVQALDSIRTHRHELAHELLVFIGYPDWDIDIDLFGRAITILRKLHRFWIEVELSAGGFVSPEGDEILVDDPDEVAPLSLQLLQMCLDAVAEEFESASRLSGTNSDLQ